MDKYEELRRAQRDYKTLFDLINSGDYKPTLDDFEELDRARIDLESAYADIGMFEVITDKGDF